MTKERVGSYPQPDRWSYLWLAVGTLLMPFLAGSWPISLAAWLAPVFFIRLMRTRKVLPGYILAVIGLSIANTVGWWAENPMPGVPAPIFGLVVGLSYSVAFLVDRLLVPRLRGRDGQLHFAATLVFPLFLTAFEFLFYSNLTYGSYGSWAYAQHSNLGLMQLTSVTGLWGLTFLVGWFGSVVNWTWERSFSWPEIRGGVAVFGGILLVVLAFGDIRLTLSFPNASRVRVHSFTALDEFGERLLVEDLFPLLQIDIDALRRRTASMSDLYIEGTIREAQAGAQIVVWPEASVVGLKEDIDAVVARGEEVARQEDIYLAMGPYILFPDEDRQELRLIVVDPSGKIVIDHLKYAYGMGTRLNEVDLQTVDTPYGRLSGVLCGDLDFPGVVKQAGQKGVDILLNPSMEVRADESPWHVRYAAFRAVENGVSLVRATAGGVSIATDPYGRVLASMDHLTTDDRVMVAQVPTRRVPSVYAMVGDLFGWLAVVGFVILAGWAILRGRKGGADVAASPESQARSM